MANTYLQNNKIQFSANIQETLIEQNRLDKPTATGKELQMQRKKSTTKAFRT